MPDKPAAVAESAPKLLDQMRERLRVKHYSLRTEVAYLGWIKRYILFHGKRHPSGMGKEEVETFLTHLAVERNVAAATQGQALSALLFLCQEVLGQVLPWLDEVTRAKKPQRLPTVLTQAETAALVEPLRARVKLRPHQHEIELGAGGGLFAAGAGGEVSRSGDCVWLAVHLCGADFFKRPAFG